MATHQNGSASTFSTPARALKHIVDADPERYLGKDVLARFGGAQEVPFVFKILSAGKALPLQVRASARSSASTHS